MLKGTSTNPPPVFGVNPDTNCLAYCWPDGSWLDICAIGSMQGPTGPQGPKGDTGATGPAGPALIGAPNVLTPAFGSVYQATDTTKPSFLSAMIDTAYSITVAGTQADTVELRIGSSSTGLSAGTGGTAVSTFRASLTGIALTVGLGLGQRNQLTAWLPTAWYWCIRRVSGTTATITSATDQALG